MNARDTKIAIEVFPALAGFQKESLRRKSDHVTDNNNHNNHETTPGESKRRKIQPSDRLRIFFWVSYDVSHEFKTRHPKILRGENFERVSQPAPTKAKFRKL